jgi:hypothetical protein
MSERVEIDAVQPHPGNARRGDVNAIANSLTAFGQRSKIIVQRSTNFIVKGNHTWKAAKQLGWTHVDVEFQDFDDVQARAYMLADNATSDKADYDKGALLNLLSQALPGLEGSGYTHDDFEALSEEVNAPEVRGRQRREVDFEDREAEEDDAPEPQREIPLRVSASKIESFAEQVNDLLQLWELETFADVVLRAIKEAHDRWQAGVGVVGKRADSSDALPEELKAGADF